VISSRFGAFAVAEASSTAGEPDYIVGQDQFLGQGFRK
jgi:hypothetical protein